MSIEKEKCQEEWSFLIEKCKNCFCGDEILLCNIVKKYIFVLSPCIVTVQLLLQKSISFSFAF